MITGIRQNVTHINRSRQIAHVMAKHGLGYYVDQMGISNLLPRLRRKDLSTQMPKKSLAVTYRIIFEELGPTFIKLGQILSTRPDIISKEYVEEFSKLQDSVAPISFDKIKEVIEKELNAPIDTVFTFLDEVPIASASIGQVHRGILLDGNEVAIKVQKPNIERIINTDTEIMRNLAKRSKNLFGQRSPYDPEEIVEEFAKAIKKELDYNIETANAERFGREFYNDPTVKIPKIFKRFGTKRLLVMEYIDGIKISDVLHLEYTEKEKAHLAEIGANAVLKMIFEFGFFHADPHPANIFVVDKNTIAFLDFGIIGRINKNAKRNLTSLLIAIINKDAEKIGDILVHMMSATDVNKDELVYELEDLIDVYYNRSLEEINMGEFLQDLTLSVKRHGMKMPKNYALLGKTLIMIEGVGRQLNPNFNSVQYTKPYVKKIIMERMGPKNIVKRWYEMLSQTSGMAVDIPKKIDNIMTRLSKGEFRVGVESKSMEYLTHSFERSVNRLSFSIVIAGMILSSSVLFMTNIGPKIYNLPLFGWIGFIISFTLGIWLISGIVKTGKL